jgi:polyhydroxyalkanoate synthesis repressor PhaR
MRVIKRYANRKLYDTEAKQYVTLDGIADLLREGVDVQVVDHTNGDDLTAVTLAQIVFEQEKRPGGQLPHGLLARLVRAGGDTLTNMRRVLGTGGLAAQVDAEIARRFALLAERGQLAASEAERLRDQLLAIAPHPSLHAAEPEAQDLAVPSRAELDQLTKQIETLTAMIEELERGGRPARKKASGRSHSKA